MRLGELEAAFEFEMAEKKITASRMHSMTRLNGIQALFDVGSRHTQTLRT
jgi:hypothetical protein